MPIQSPPRIQGIPRPPSPESPATLEDVSNAIDYARAAFIAQGRWLIRAHLDELGANDVARALRDLVATIQRVEERLQHLEERIYAMNEQVIEAAIASAQAINWDQHDGSLREFQIVRLPGGGLPQNLPRLRNLAAIRSLTGAQAKEYCIAYRIERRGNRIQDNRKAISRHIGCSVPLD
ncbi:hypothetical protein Clacol_001119 [Clathrus columnatus]|uniref:Mug135-like C-terminal domain-containing protein n=1 Tax=Clathrus columnatus TaxID=1419009 RepID=A0AAV5A125_9AGAM|nr:hypothetical protein Clacol_001119 [Clathrus columnatus]